MRSVCACAANVHGARADAAHSGDNTRSTSCARAAHVSDEGNTHQGCAPGDIDSADVIVCVGVIDVESVIDGVSAALAPSLPDVLLDQDVDGTAVLDGDKPRLIDAVDVCESVEVAVMDCVSVSLDD